MKVAFEKDEAFPVWSMIQSTDDLPRADKIIEMSDEEFLVYRSLAKAYWEFNQMIGERPDVQEPTKSD